MREELIEEFEEEKLFKENSKENFSSESSENSILVKRVQEFEKSMNSLDY